MSALALIFLLALPAAGFGVTCRLRAALRDAATYGRHAAAGPATYTARGGWNPRVLPVPLVRSLR